jgi:predicted permease
VAEVLGDGDDDPHRGAQVRVIRPGIRRFFRIALRRGDVVARNVDEEIRAHLDMRAEQLVREGFSPDEAHVEAARRFGSLEEARRDLQEHAKQRERTMQFREWVDALKQDVRYAARGLRREPLFTAFVVATLALGIGANAAMFGVIDRLLLRGPAHVVDASRVMRVYFHARVPGQGDYTGDGFGYVTYDVLKRDAHSFDGVAAYVANSHQAEVMGHGADAELVDQGQATADLFTVLGVKPALGRFFTTAEDSVEGPARVAVLGFGLWQRAFGGDRSVLGKSIVLRDVPYTIIGVAPSGFTGPQLGRVDVWLPVSLHVTMGSPDWSRTWDSQWLRIIARLKPGVTVARASDDATAVYRPAYAGGDKSEAGSNIFLAPLSFGDSGKETTEIGVSRWLVGVAFIVLMIACANVVNLLLARAVRRRREVAVRLALGAGQRRLIQLLLTESLLLAALGGAAGLAVAWITGRLLRSVLLSNVEWTSSPVDGRVLAISAAIALGVGIVVGLVPALRSSKQELTPALKSGVREGGMRGARLRSALTVAQAAMSIVLLAGAGLFMRSLSNVRSLDLGIQADRMIAAYPRWPAIADRDTAAQRVEKLRRASVYLQALERMRRMPGVEHAALTVGLPFRSGFQQALRVQGWDSLPKAGGYPGISAATSEYFEAAGTRLLSGRTFTPADRRGSEPIAIVSNTMAKTLWPRGNAIGQCIFTGPGKENLTVCSRVVGVVADARKQSLREKPQMHYYVPFGQERGMGGTDLIVRPRGDVAAMIREIQRTFHEMDPTIAYVYASTLQVDVDSQARPWLLGASMFGLMGLLALVVAAVGLYSVMSYLVAQRTHELGVRIALGASGGNIVSLVFRNSAGMAAMGIAIGLGLTLLAGRFVEPLLFDTSARDAGVLTGVSLAMIAVAAIASVIPAMRARGTDPMEALRTE